MTKLFKTYVKVIANHAKGVMWQSCRQAGFSNYNLKTIRLPRQFLKQVQDFPRNDKTINYDKTL